MTLQILQCPNCSAAIPKIPERKTKCPNCNKFYYRRAHPKTRNEYKIVTEEEAKHIDALWLKINTAHLKIKIDREKINKLYSKLDTIRGWINSASIFGGGVHLGGEDLNIYQLEEMEVSIIASIDLELNKLQQRWYLGEE